MSIGKTFAAVLAAAIAAAGCETLENAKAMQEAVEAQGRDDYKPEPSEYLDLTGYTLEDLVVFAITNRPSMMNMYLELEDAKLALKEIDASAPIVSGTPWNAFSANVSAGYSESSQRSHGLGWRERGKASAALSLDLLVWDWGRNAAQAQAQAERIVATEHKVYDTCLTIFEEVTTAYFNVLTADAMLDIAMTNEYVNAVQVERATRRLEAGETQRSDLLQAKKNLAAAKELVVVRRDNVKTAGAELVKVLGFDASRAGRDDILEPRAEPLDKYLKAFPITDFTLEEAFDFSRTNSPSVRIARAKLRAASKSVDSAKADLLPRLSLSGSVNWTDPLWWWSWGANLTQNLFSGFSNVTAVDRAVLAMQMAAFDLKETEQQLSKQLSDAIATRDDARVACNSAEATCQAAKENYEVVAQQYMVGECNQLDYADAVNTLVTALGDRVQNFYLEQKAEASLYRYLGVDPEYEFEEVGR